MSFATGFAERYVAGTSRLHRTDARVKLVTTLAFILLVTLVPVASWTALALLAAPVLLLAALSGVSPRILALRSALALPFMLAALPLLFTKPGETLFTLPSLGPLLGWEASAEGARAVGTILAKSWISVAAAVVLTATTPATELVGALRSLRLPRLLTAVVFFAYRYLNVIGGEGQRMMRARDSRSARLPGQRSGGSLRWRARVLGGMVGSLFLRSFERSERVYAAMQARGYDGEPRFLSAPSMSFAQLAAGAALLAFAAAVVVVARV